MEISLWIVTGLSALCWLGSWALFARLRNVPRCPAKAGPPAPAISVIVPARDEEHNIGRLLESLQAQEHPALEVIVVDDQSEDRTAERARELGAIVVPGKAPPDSWLGKPWACRQGSEMAAGTWLLFLDADTELAPEGLARLAALTRNEEDVHSVCPYHRVRAPYEQLSAFFNVIMILGMNAFTLRGPRARDIGLFGQAMLISRRQYDCVDGHSRVKAEVLENFHLARHLRAENARLHCWLGRGTINMRMFPHSLRDLVAGWSKGILSGAGNTAKSALAGVSVWLSGLFMSAIPVCFVPFVSRPLAFALGAVYLLHVLQVGYLFRRTGNFSWLSALAFPVGLVFYHYVFLHALARRRRGDQIKWKGRHVG